MTRAANDDGLSKTPPPRNPGVVRRELLLASSAAALDHDPTDADRVGYRLIQGPPGPDGKPLGAFEPYLLPPRAFHE